MGKCLMDKDFLIKTTNELYRLTLFFPKKEPLKYKMREVASKILSDPKKEEFEILENFFFVAQNQNWVSPSDILAVKENYSKLKQEFEQEKQQVAGNQAIEEEAEVVREKIGENELLLPERQKKIINILKDRGRLQVSQAQHFFPQVSKRTLRRDFEQMFRQGIIERMGERNETFYKIRAKEA